MPIASPERVLSKFRRLHERIGGSDRVVSFIKYNNAVEDYYTAPSDLPEITTVTPQPVVKDQPGEDLQNAFPGGIFADQRLFTFLADSFVDRLPLSTLSKRCEDFLIARSGQTQGGILYGDTVYAIERFFARPIIGTVAARYIVLASSQKTENS